MKKYMCLLSILFSCLALSGCLGLMSATQMIPKELKEPETETKYILKQEKAYVLKDGTAIDLWQPSYEDALFSSYRLQDGQELLVTFSSTSVENTNSNGLKGIETMAPEALEAVRAYYKNQGILLDIPSLLENAYADYKACLEKKKQFELHFAEQDIEPCVETERFIGFTTTWAIPGRGVYDALSMYRTILFDQMTGQVIPITDLFTVPKEKVWDILAELCAKHAYEDLETIRPLMTPERIHWAQNAVVAYFYVDELGSLETGVEIPYDELKEYLNDWAIPKPVPEEDYSPQFGFW